jgi:hypothetical protein
MASTLKARIVDESKHDSIMALMESVWDETCEDGAEFRDYSLSPLDLWVGLYDGELLVGALRFRQWNGSTVQMCVQVEKKHRKEYSQHVARAVHEWIPANIKRFPKIVSFIPEYFANVVDFARRSGWDEEGSIQKAFQKEGKLHNILVFGKMVEEMRA